MARQGTIYIDRPIVENQTADKDPEVKKLEKLAQESEKTIYELSSVFPFQLFPDKIIIDKLKVTVIRNDLFYRRTFPILIEDIKTIKVTGGILFASMEFEVAGYEENPQAVTHLWPKDATKAKQYILGLIKTTKEKIDLSALSTDQVKKNLEEIGKAKEEV